MKITGSKCTKKTLQKLSPKHRIEREVNKWVDGIGRVEHAHSDCVPEIRLADKKVDMHRQIERNECQVQDHQSNRELYVPFFHLLLCASCEAVSQLAP